MLGRGVAQVALSPGASWERSRPGNARGKQKGTKGEAESWDRGQLTNKSQAGRHPGGGNLRPRSGVDEGSEEMSSKTRRACVLGFQ